MKTNDSYDAPFLEMPNGLHPYPDRVIHYGTTKVPHPTNSSAKIVPHEEVIRAVLKGK